MRTKLRSQLSKIKFALGYNPIVVKRKKTDNIIPKNYKAVLTITADFELAWAPRYSHKHLDPLTSALEYARRERRNVPRILEICDEYGIPATWATVGHLFLDSCEQKRGKKHPEVPAVPAYEGNYWSFKGGDWFEYDPCSDLHSAPEWYAPDLIDQILSTKVKHEIGCHTFSHIDCRDEVCPKELFESELQMCKKLANEKSLELKSFVHPGHTIGNLDTLAQLGFTSFQSDPGNILGYPVRHQNGLWELQRTMELTYRPEWSINYHIKRYKKIVDRAIKNQIVCNFWFHPSFPSIFVYEIFPDILEYIKSRNDELYVTTVSNYIDFLNQNVNSKR